MSETPRPTVPVLETPRLRLRAHRPSDLDDAFAMWASPDVYRHIGGQPSTRQDVWMRMLRYRGHWDWLGYGYWAIEDRATGRFLGEVGFADFKRELEPAIEGIPEMGWVLAPAAHGRGIGTEGVDAAMAWADARLSDHPRTVCLVAPENAPSIRLAAKLGFREYARTAYKGEPTILLERPRPSSR